MSPPPPPPPPNARSRMPLGRRKLLALLLFISAFGLFLQPLRTLTTRPLRKSTTLPLHPEAILSRCRALDAKPMPPPNFHRRTKSDRYEPGVTRAVLIRNATIWTGLGSEVVRGDVFMDAGIIHAVGVVDPSMLALHVHETIDAQGAWVTPGIVDMHSHLGMWAAPMLDGANDLNSHAAPTLVLPWLRTVDALNTHDEGFALAVAGGVTTSLILPGSANAVGGQAFVAKLRPTQERSPSSLLLEPPFELDGTASEVDREGVPPRWRHMKHACGENPASYVGTRMETVWLMRQGYEHARTIKNAQDQYCSKALAGQWTGLGEFPSELAWEALVDVLRGKVKVHTHCYEAVDIDAFVRLSNEFKFEVAAFHHAQEAYLVPEVLNRTYGRPPAVAMFATCGRYKREAYRHSEFAPRILADYGFKVVMKSDHPALLARYVMHEAQQAHFYGLGTNLALASVTSTPAQVLGLDHRIGFVKPGYDADIVVWDSHPLALGATPSQVFIDGIPQFPSPYVSEKPASHQHAPKTPNWDQERQAAVEFDGLPPLEAPRPTTGTVVFRNVSSFWTRGNKDDAGSASIPIVRPAGNVVVENGVVVWSGPDAELIDLDSGALVVDLQGGSICPALVSIGAQLGLQEIEYEDSTSDGVVLDPLSQNIPAILGTDTLIRAVDGLEFGTRDALLAYRAGVGSGITAPSGQGVLSQPGLGFLQGLSVFFSLGSPHKLETGAVLQEIVALHVKISLNLASSVSTQIATLRRLLLDTHTSKHFRQASEGIIPLVITVDSADIIATLLLLKKEVEVKNGKAMKMTIIGGAEAHLLASELAAANVGVILAPSRSYPYTWEQRRILSGPPLSAQSSAAWLAVHNVTVGLGPQGSLLSSAWAALNLRFDMAWVALESNSSISKEAALAMASSNIEELLGIQPTQAGNNLVVTSGGDIFSFEGKVVAMISSRRGVVDLFER
ncbi:hypothetical protein C8J57DRAFT_1316535 [Mycena rebaudengoi]|nr:hypothetical protein C8J57DRAFT_1316535 [Mycena rebaudengoi]